MIRTRPFVTVNFAVTFDGRITTRNRTPSDFSSRADKRRLLEIRATGDAVLVGHGTIKHDRMTMSVKAPDLREERRRNGKPASPLRIIVSNTGRIDPGLRVFQEGDSPVIVYSTRRMPATRRKLLAPLATLRLHDADSVDLAAMLGELRRTDGVKRVVCEGGGMLFRSLASQRLVDEIHLTLCPLVFGGLKAATMTGLAGGFLPRSLRCELAKMEVIGEECYLRYRVLH